jgi:hypothetical protein
MAPDGMTSLAGSMCETRFGKRCFEFSNLFRHRFFYDSSITLACETSKDDRLSPSTRRSLWFSICQEKESTRFSIRFKLKGDLSNEGRQHFALCLNNPGMVSNDNLENNGSSRVKDLVMVNLDQALDAVMQLPREQQETLLDIVRHHHIEQRRDEIVQDAQRSLEEFQAAVGLERMHQS